MAAICLAGFRVPAGKPASQSADSFQIVVPGLPVIRFILIRLRGASCLHLLGPSGCLMQGFAVREDRLAFDVPQYLQ